MLCCLGYGSDGLWVSSISYEATVFICELGGVEGEKRRSECSSDAIVSTLTSVCFLWECRVHVQNLQTYVVSVSKGEVERELYGCYETKPRECALIFMSLWVWWWYNACSEFFIPDETQYVGYIPQYWSSITLKTVMLSLYLGKKWDCSTWACFHGKNDSFFFPWCRPFSHFDVT